MHKTAWFWVILAVLYGVLAGVSLRYGMAYDEKIGKAPHIQVTAQGGTRQAVGPGTVEIGAGGQDEKVVADLWGDLRSYLTLSTWVNSGGFVLAAIAAIASFMSARQTAGKVTGKT